MMTIEEIKKASEFADGFEYLTSKYNSLDDQIRIEGCDYARRYDLYDKTWTNFIYPLFIQRVIEGINREYLNKQIDYWIEMNHSQISCHCDYKGYQLYENYKNIDQAKTQAIKYILEAL